MKLRLIPAFATTLAVSLSLTLASCSQDGGLGAANTENTLLAYIPEDAAYMAANLEPVPSEVLQAMFMRLQPALDAVQAELAQTRSDLSGSADRDDSGEALALAILDELDGNLNPAGLESLGFSMDAYQAFYGMGVFPVVRISLANPQGLRDTIARIEFNSGVEFPVQDYQGQSFWRLAEDHGDGDVDGGIYLAIIENGKDAHLAFSVFPSDAEPELLPAFLGQVMPGDNSAANQLAAINQEYGYSSHGTGFLDFQRLFDELTNPDSLLNRSIDQEGSDRLSGLDEVCHAEISDLIDRAPRMVAGATEMTPEAMGVQYRLELANDLASDLASLVANVPPVPTATDRLLEFSLGIRIGAARDFLFRKATELSQAQFECDHLQDINRKASEALVKLNYPMPPLVNNFLGFRASVSEMPEDQNDMSTARGTFALHMDKPEMVVGMAKMFLPQMEELDLTRGAAPVELPQDLVPMPGVSAYAAMSDNALGLSLGQGEEASLGDFLADDTNSSGSFFSVNYDMGAYMDKMDMITDDLIAAGVTNDFDVELGNHHDSEVERAFREVFRNMAGRNHLELSFDRDGFAIDSVFEFQD